jgi:peptidoglycan/xylan/chitin deacetylase (PgdA/CDA1 family)
MYFIKTPWLLRTIFKQLLWRLPNQGNTIYLTFDDGPIPGVTPWVLDTLAQHQAKATFFCVGENVTKHPLIYQDVLAAGHSVGNHTYNHLNGWKTPTDDYLENVALCAKALNSNLFRPPYGKLSPTQLMALQKNYHIVMWDVLSADFDQSIRPEQCLQNVLTHTQAGSIVVLHDSLKAEINLRYILPRLLEHFGKQGYTFAALP